MIQIHALKIEPQYLEAKLAGDKLFEIRENDRGYQKGDIVEYRECKYGEPTKIHRYVITYVTSYAQQCGHVVFGERKMEVENE